MNASPWMCLFNSSMLMEQPILYVSILSTKFRWSFNLSDEDGDSIWTGQLDFQPSGVGQPSLKVIATDGEGDAASVDILYTPLKVVEADGAGFMSTGVLIGGVSISILAALLIALQRRRKTAEEMKLIDSWGVFGDGIAEDEASDDETEDDENWIGMVFKHRQQRRPYNNNELFSITSMRKALALLLTSLLIAQHCQQVLLLMNQNPLLGVLNTIIQTSMETLIQ